jgi:hypothetical protein
VWWWLCGGGRDSGGLLPFRPRLALIKFNARAVNRGRESRSPLRPRFPAQHKKKSLWEGNSSSVWEHFYLRLNCRIPDPLFKSLSLKSEFRNLSSGAAFCCPISKFIFELYTFQHFSTRYGFSLHEMLYETMTQNP